MVTSPEVNSKYPIRLENNLNDIKELSVLSRMESVNSDLIRMFIGEKLGAGSYRSVYSYNPEPHKYVIKVEPNATGCNANEFLIWQEVSGLCGSLRWVKDWFAPVLWMSPDARILIMERTENNGLYERPEKVPNFMSDIKNDNFGWIGDKFVCHDYGFINRFIKYEKKFRKAEWH